MLSQNKRLFSLLSCTEGKVETICLFLTTLNNQPMACSFHDEILIWQCMHCEHETYKCTKSSYCIYGTYLFGYTYYIIIVYCYIMFLVNENSFDSPLTIKQ